MPFDGEGQWARRHYAEVVCAVRVFPYVFAIDNYVLAKRLLEARVEFVAPSRANRTADTAPLRPNRRVPSR